MRDTGPGVAAQEQDRIFSRFVRARGNRHRDGAGLGLSIERAIAEAHGGTVQVHSRPGAGALLTLVLPSHTEAERNEHEEAEVDAA